jgi:hypothetical protein
MKKKNLLMTVIAIFGLATITFGQTVPSYIPTSGLVGWWPFNGNANDQSGNGNNGSVNGASLTFDRFGQTSTAYSFDGINNFIQVNNAAIFNLVNGHSISVWFKPNSIHQAVIIEKFNQTNGLGDGGPQLVLRSNQLVDFSIFHNNTGNFVYSNIPSTNQLWHHIVATWNGNLIRLYQNGLLTDSIPLSVTLNQCNEPMMIGKRSFQNDLHFDGVIDDIGMWNRALTQLEITNLYNAVNCNNNLAITPQNNNLLAGSTAIFNATTSDANPNYVWQSDFGQGFQTLNNFGNYSGVNTNALSIANVQLSEHNQPIRVISTSGNCIDTSNVAVINIMDTCIVTINDTITTLISVTDTLIINTTVTGLTPPNNLNTIKVFPNPANDHITINYGNFASMSGYTLKITNNLGQVVFTTPITQQSSYIDLSTWTGNGIYFVQIIDTQNNTVENRKIVIQ